MVADPIIRISLARDLMEGPPSAWNSAGILLAAAIRHWVLIVTGTIMSLTGLIADSLDFKIPAWAFVVTGVGVLFVAIVKAFHDVRVERDQLRQQQEPKCELRATGSAAYQRGNNADFGAHQMRRLYVCNTSSQALVGVRVLVVNVRPDPNELRSKMPLMLLPQHAINVTPDYRFTLGARAEQPIDVFVLSERFAWQFYLFHAVHWTTKALPWGGGSYLLDIQVVSDNAPPITRVVKIGADKSNDPTLEIVHAIES